MSTDMALALANRISPIARQTRVAGWLSAAQSWIARYRLYRHTLRELNMLSEVELRDLGLHRSMLRRIALEAVNDVTE